MCNKVYVQLKEETISTLLSSIDRTVISLDGNYIVYITRKLMDEINMGKMGMQMLKKLKQQQYINI